MLELLKPSKTTSFADIVHQSLNFESDYEPERLVLDLLDTKWVQRLRSISQTGNTKLVYMFAEHSRFGHCLGVAYLANLLMKHLMAQSEDLVRPYANAVSAAALLHDVGHVAPGSHLGERVWAIDGDSKHEALSRRIIEEDKEIGEILTNYDPNLQSMVCDLLSDKDSMPPWTRASILGGGWNADRGNWAIVDSAMCCVSYGRYNITALINAFRLSSSGELILQESRLDALNHFFMARDSMYRQVYRHRVLQAVDALTLNLVKRVRGLVSSCPKEPAEAARVLGESSTFCDEVMIKVLLSENYAREIPLDTAFAMTEGWWHYHVERWCSSKDQILSDLATRLRDRRLFKTVRLENGTSPEKNELVHEARAIAQQLGYDPEYYVAIIGKTSSAAAKREEPPMVLLDSGKIVPVTELDPMIDQIMSRPPKTKTWIAVPEEVKEKLGRYR